MTNNKFGNFDVDLEKEQILTKWIVNNFLSSETDDFKVIKDEKTQNTGVDFVITSEDIFGYDLPYKVDFKAALNYIKPMKDKYNNKPQKMPTFAFELSFKNKYCEEREGWLFGEKYNNTEYYMLGWVWADLPFFYNEKGFIEVKSKTLNYKDIKEVEIMIIHKESIRNYANKHKINEESAITISKEMRNKNTYERFLGLKNDYPKIRYSSNLDEKPVNLVISTNDLEKMAIFHKTITDLPTVKMNSKPNSEVVSSTMEDSCELFNNGRTVREISQERELTYSTIINHLYKGASVGLLNPTSSYLSKNIISSIQSALKYHDKEDLTSIKKYLDKKIGKDVIKYDEIKRYFIEAYSKKIIDG